MKISKAELANSPHLRRLLSPEAAKSIGLEPLPNTDSKTNSSPPPTLKELFKDLTPAEKRRLKGDEAKQHGILCAWLVKNEIPFIHAPTSRRVHDLPPGWPDFTVFHKIEDRYSDALPFNIAYALFIEIKVPGGSLSWEQIQWQKRLPVQMCATAYDAMRLAASFCRLPIPVFQPPTSLPI
jgi:hypothetical protein